MAYRLSYFKWAKIDIRETKTWYKSQLPGLEKRFAKDLEACINRLKINPYIYAVRYDNFRIAHADTSPYAIHFYIDNSNERVVIVGIIHDSRDVIIIKSVNST